MTNFPGVPSHFTDEERQIYITSILSFDNTCMVCHHFSTEMLQFTMFICKVKTLGALLKYMDKKRIGVELEGANVRVPILAVKPFSL